MKRLIKTRKLIHPYKIYQTEDSFTVELDDVEVYRTKHQHLTTSYCEVKLAEQRRIKNDLIYKNIQELKASGII